MAPSASADRRPPLQVSLPVDDLARYAGLIGLVSATLAIAGVFATTAYLSAWMVPAPVIRLDPLTAALRSDLVLEQSLNLALVVFGLDALARRLPARRTVRLPVLGALVALLALRAGGSLLAGFTGPVLTLAGGLALLVLHHRDRVSPRATVLGFVVLSLGAAYLTGSETGRLIRDDTAMRTPVTLTTRSQVGGLGGSESGSGWTYRGLYLVFRDGESVYVAEPGGGSRVWVVPTGNVMALGIGG